MIEAALKQLELPEAAYEWLFDVWEAIQLFDDVADGDEIESEVLNRVIWSVFVRSPRNPFYRANVDALTPVLALQIAKWHAANSVEDADKADERSYMWRAGYYDLVLTVCMLCFGEKIETGKICDALMLYGETYEEYAKEMKKCLSQ